MIDKEVYLNNVVNDLLNKCNQGAKRITFVSPTGLGKSLVSQRIAEAFLNNNKKVVFVFGMLVLVDFFNKRFSDMNIDVENNPLIELTTIHGLYNKQGEKNKLKNCDCIIAYDLHVNERTKFGSIFKDCMDTIISFCSLNQELTGEKTFLSHMQDDDIEEQNSDLTIDEEDDFSTITSKFSDFSQKYYLIFVANKLMDVRDISAASPLEKADVINQVKMHRENICKIEQEFNDTIKKLEDKISEINVILDKKNSEILRLRKELEIQLKEAHDAKDEYIKYNAFLVLVYNAAGIPKEKLDLSYRKIEEYRFELNDKIDAFTTRMNMEKYYNDFQNETVKTLYKITEENRNNLSTEKYQDLLIENLGQEVWNKLDSKSRSFLITAKMTYDSMREIKGETDYSGVCLLVTKAIEVETTKRFYDRYISYLEREYPIATQISKWPSCMLDKDNNSILEAEKFTLGSVMFIVGINTKGTTINNYFYRSFDRYAYMELYKDGISSIKRNIKLTKCVEFIERVKIDYRNPAAHRNQLTVISAKECLDYVLDTQKKLKEMLIDFKF